MTPAEIENLTVGDVIVNGLGHRRIVRKTTAWTPKSHHKNLKVFGVYVSIKICNKYKQAFTDISYHKLRSCYSLVKGEKGDLSSNLDKRLAEDINDFNPRNMRVCCQEVINDLY